MTELRFPGTFNNIELISQIDLTIYNGNEFKVEVIGGEHIIKNISTKISGDLLIIENKNVCNFVRGYKRRIAINVTLPHVVKVINSGVGTIRFAESYSQDTLIVRATSSGDIVVNGTYNQIRTSSHGNGNIYVSGSSNSFYVYANGLNFVFAENLMVKDYTFIETLSLGDCNINATKLQKLEYNIHDNGNINYTGNPPIINDFSDGKAKGKAIKQD